MKDNQRIALKIFEKFPEYEWNYSDLYRDKIETRIATIYEYTRCRDWIANRYVSWLDTPIENKKSNIIDSLHKLTNGCCSPRRILKLVQEFNPNDDKDKKNVKNLFLALAYSMPECLQGHCLTPQMLYLLEFPTPFMMIRKAPWFSTMKRFDYAILEFAKRGEIQDKPEENWPFSQNLKVLEGYEEVTIAVNWNRKDAAIIEDLKKWLKRSRPFPEPTSRNRGAGYPLKCLAAQRLNRAFKQSNVSPIHIATCLHHIFGNEIQSKSIQELVPFYSEQGAVSRAAKDCLKFIGDRIAFYWRYSDSVDAKRIAIPWEQDNSP